MTPPTDAAAWLQPGESLIWAGRPDPDRQARSARVLVGIGLLFLATSLGFFLILRAILSAWLALAGLPFALMGAVMVAAPALARRRAERTLYALTDRRAVVRRPAWLGGEAIEQFAPGQIDAVSCVEDPDGTGHLVFFLRESIQGEVMVTARTGFQAIDGAQEVEALVRRTLLDTAEEPPA